MVARKLKVEKVTEDDIVEFRRWDAGLVSRLFPSHIHVLTIHGLEDTLVE